MLTTKNDNNRAEQTANRDKQRRLSRGKQRQTEGPRESTLITKNDNNSADQTTTSNKQRQTDAKRDQEIDIYVKHACTMTFLFAAPSNRSKLNVAAHAFLISTHGAYIWQPPGDRFYIYIVHILIYIYIYIYILHIFVD